MKTIEIKHRFTGAVLYSTEVEDTDPQPIRTAVTRANLTRADLAGANLTGANLTGANLADAYLAGADLADAYLAGARNLPTWAKKTDPPVPYVRAVTDEDREARRAARMREYRQRNPDVPVIEHLDARILAAITVDGCALEMGSWHTCGTTHCRGGWAVVLAGEPGKALEVEVGVEKAARRIYRASTGRVPYFFASNARALDDIKACAARDPLPAGTEVLP